MADKEINNQYDFYKEVRIDGNGGLIVAQESGTASEDYFINHAIANILADTGDVVSVASAQKDLLKFGRNRLCNISKTTLMTLPIGTDNEVLLSANDITTISSDDAADTVEVKVEGHTIAAGVFTFVVQTATLNGQNQVTLTTPLARVSRVVNNSATDLVGDIYVYETDTTTAGVPDTDAKVHIMIEAGFNNSEKAATTISGTQYWILTSFYADCLEKKSDYGTVHLEVREQGKTFINKVDISASTHANGDHFFKPYLIVPKNADIRLRVSASTAGKDFSGGIQGTLLGIV